MKVTVVRLALASLWITCLVSGRLEAVEFGGGGSAKRDCLVTFDAAINYPTSKPKQVRCVDGDPTCDADAMVDGVCSFELSVCANSTFEPSCTLDAVQSIIVDHAEDNGDRKFDPDFQSVQTAIDGDIQPPTNTTDLCTLPTTILVPIKGPIGKNRCGPQRKKIKLTALSQVIDGRIYKDRDRIKFTCIPAPNGCEPTSLYSGTFDRIQRQILNQSCALSGCHDSQTQAGNLLLDSGAAYGNLLNVSPSNPSASGAGWLRVDAPNPPGTSGDASNSYLFNKIDDNLPAASYGERMPLNQRKLNKTLRQVIELWIEAGAPQTGWVPGTD
jgi:hypothetical protein